MRKAIRNTSDLRTTCSVTHHAWRRMCERGMSPDVVLGVIQYGRKAYVRGAVIYAVGRREVRRFSWRGVDLVDMEGVQVVCSIDGALMTVYRNHDFRGLRPRPRSRRRYSHPFAASYPQARSRRSTRGRRRH